MADDRYIDEATADKWARLSILWREASERLETIRLELLTELHVAEGKPLDVTNAAIDAVSGNAYMFHPQPEWTGGDSSDPKNTKFRKPHIAEGVATRFADR
jgi:hypothetical protein